MHNATLNAPLFVRGALMVHLNCQVAKSGECLPRGGSLPAVAAKMASIQAGAGNPLRADARRRGAPAAVAGRTARLLRKALRMPRNRLQGNQMVSAVRSAFLTAEEVK